MPRSQAPAHAASRTTAPAPAPLAERLGFLLKHAYQTYQSIQLPALAPIGLDGRLLAVLLVVQAEGPSLQQRLSERMGVDRTTMVALVDILEQTGFVERRRDAGDRRGYQINITGKGAALLRKATNVIHEVEQDFLAPLSPREQRQFRTLVTKLALERGRPRA